MSFMAVEKGVGLIGLEAIQIHSTGGRTRATPSMQSLQTPRHLKEQPLPAAPPNLCASKKRLLRADKKRLSDCSFVVGMEPSGFEMLPPYMARRH